jgi:hypothetical protein
MNFFMTPLLYFADSSREARADRFDHQVARTRAGVDMPAERSPRNDARPFVASMMHAATVRPSLPSPGLFDCTGIHLAAARLRRVAMRRRPHKT